jgi:hypothetical protein
MPIDRVRACVAVVACVVVPLATWAFDHRNVGYTMYAGVTVYRVRVVATREGQESPVSCDAIAGVVSGSARFFLDHADAWRTARSTVALRAHVDAIARGACVVSHADAVDVAIEEQGRDDVTHARRSCP